MLTAPPLTKDQERFFDAQERGETDYEKGVPRDACPFLDELDEVAWTVGWDAMHSITNWKGER